MDEAETQSSPQQVPYYTERQQRLSEPGYRVCALPTPLWLLGREGVSLFRMNGSMGEGVCIMQFASGDLDSRWELPRTQVAL